VLQAEEHGDPAGEEQRDPCHVQAALLRSGGDEQPGETERREHRDRQRQIPDYDGQQIIEVVRDSSCQLTNRFESFLSVVEQNGPDQLREAARELRDGGDDSHFQLLTVFWNGTETGPLPPAPHDFFACAFLQPYAAGIRSRSSVRWSGPTPYRCPFCKRKPGVGVLRPLGDGGQRSLVCSFCLAEWEFRRIVCPGCGEENHAKLPVYTAEELKHVRVEGCDSCRSYIKTVDLTKSGLAEPIVDEMASIPLDLWAQKQGYAKLQCNLLQL